MVNIPKGTKDTLPNESYKNLFLEELIRDVAKLFGFKEIRTPTFEYTELFLRGIGNGSDIVNKEMYTFLDKGQRSLTLRPEGTAGVVRSYIENNLSSLGFPLRMYYISPAFRYERPQAGRLREHHQFGCELYGSFSPYADAEIIQLLSTFFNRLGIKDVVLNINSIGCKKCRSNYTKALILYLKNIEDKLCNVCKDRLIKNPLRILDCKEEVCVSEVKNAPKTIDYLCSDCLQHHNSLSEILTSENIPFVVNPHIVRGLDYYTRTVFEFISSSIGAQGTVCGGGRYDDLVEEMGGGKTPAVGFGIGLERLLMVCESANIDLGEIEKPLVYLAPIGDEAQKLSNHITSMLKKKGLKAETDIIGRSLKAQMKYADKIGARYVIVIGDDEISSNIVKLKEMSSGGETSLPIDDLFNFLLKNQ
ncbi:MAG: histidine--tRNA ligase [Christensenellaceae bacterium]|jgi:histidyl-tRNA synthetase|nr:histidine--tRNA ligase [Christensenellaceae bacterium]